MKIGILGRATNASTESKIGSIRDAVELAVDECQSAYMEEFAANSATSSGKIGTYLGKGAIAGALKAQGYILYEGTAATSVTAVEEGTDAKIKDAFWVAREGQTDALRVFFSANDPNSYGLKVNWGKTATAGVNGEIELETITISAGA